MKEMMQMQMLMLPTLIEKEYPVMFEEFDKDKSGVLDKEEAKLLFKSLCKDGAPQGFEFSEENFAAKFKEWDLDGDGTISKDELYMLLLKGAIDMFTAEMAKLDA